MQTETFLNLDEPFPTAYESSLIISSKVFFSSILSTSLGDSGLGLRYESNGNKDKAWITSVKAGSVFGHYPQTCVSSGSNPEPGGMTIEYYKKYVAVDNDTVSIDLSGMTGDSTKTSEWEVEMTFDMKEKEYKFKYGECHQYCYPFHCSSGQASIINIIESQCHNECYSSISRHRNWTKPTSQSCCDSIYQSVY